MLRSVNPGNYTDPYLKIFKILDDTRNIYMYTYIIIYIYVHQYELQFLNNTDSLSMFVLFI